MSNHRCPDDPLGAMFDVPMVDSETGQPYQGGFWLDCLPEVAFAWDQWMVCNIGCDHGTFRGVACGLNFIECFQDAVGKFNAYNHAEPTLQREDGEEWNDYRARRNIARSTIVEFCDTHNRRVHGHGADYDPLRQDARYNVMVHDDDGSRCTPQRAGFKWDAELPVEVSYCVVTDTGKQVDVTQTAYLTIKYWNQYWDNNLRLSTEELGRQAKAGESLHEPEEGWFQWTRKAVGNGLGNSS